MKKLCSALILTLTLAAGADPAQWTGCPANAHAAFRRDSKQLVLAGLQGAATLYDLPDGHHFALPTAPFSSGSPDFAPDGQQLALPAAGFRAAALALYGPRFANEPHTLTLPSGTPWACRYTGVGRQLIVGGDGGALLIDMPAGTVVRRFPTGRAASSLSLSPSGKRLALSDGDNVFIYDVESGQKQMEIPALRRQVPGLEDVADAPKQVILFREVHWLPDESAVLASSFTDDRTPYPIWFLDPATGKRAGKLDTRHVRGITAMAVSPDGKTMVTTAFDGEMRWWALPDKKLLDITPCLGTHKEGQVSSLTFSPDGQWLALATEWALGSLFNVSTRTVQATFGP